MEKRSKLKDNPLKLDDGRTVKIYIHDDLTKRRANLAYKARQLKNSKKIFDTWVTNCKIVVKDNYNRISLVNDTHDLLKFENAQARAWHVMPGWHLGYSCIHIRQWLWFMDIDLETSLIVVSLFFPTGTCNESQYSQVSLMFRYLLNWKISIPLLGVSIHHECHEVDGFCFYFIYPLGL